MRPSLAGLDLPGVHPLHTMDDAFTLDGSLAERDARSAVIVGAGYIGLEMAEALVHRGLSVTLVEQVEQPLPTVDPELGRLVREQLIENGVDVRTGTVVEAIEAAGAQLTVRCRPGDAVSADIVLVSVGVRPSSDLAAAAGARLGQREAIDVTPAMETSLPDVWAAGDCVNTHHRLLVEPAYLPLGTTAHKQGRVAGENAAGGSRMFAGSLGRRSSRSSTSRPHAPACATTRLARPGTTR